MTLQHLYGQNDKKMNKTQNIHKFDIIEITLGRRQSKSMNADQKSLETVFSIAICRHSVSNNFYLRSSIVLTFLIAAYLVSKW